ncbi:uncharacterized protein A4U43_C03F28260 [Asparagus officinalis]|uniref:Uncharacterized protein n=1 Tax=Asparagus officinalis TaxID=4686 RepID=A0A5P1FGD7_ASPOF|nr:uncharacterized protein A4U43_C03F28260 [Asparagus officinalis]
MSAKNPSSSSSSPRPHPKKQARHPHFSTSLSPRPRSGIVSSEIAAISLNSSSISAVDLRRMGWIGLMGDTYIWKCAEASVSHLNAYKLLTGGELSDDVINAFVIRLWNKFETTNSYDRKIHVTRLWLVSGRLAAVAVGQRPEGGVGRRRSTGVGRDDEARSKQWVGEADVVAAGFRRRSQRSRASGRERGGGVEGTGGLGSFVRLVCV